MRRLLLLAALLTSPAAFGDDLYRPVTAMFYWQKPLDALEKKDSASAFGFRLDRTAVTKSVVFRKPLLDLRFNERGFHSLALRGSVLHQNQPASGGPAPEINWWLVGGVAVGAAIVIHNENKNDTTPRRATGN
ncbi:MAG: hypothetical protein AB1452_04905 [Pseudomonadota bacterium]